MEVFRGRKWEDLAKWHGGDGSGIQAIMARVDWAIVKC